MTIDLSRPTHRPAQAARRIPPFRYRGNGRGDLAPVPTHPSTIIRWIVVGVTLSDGTRLKLDAARLPSGWVTSEDALRDFIARITADRNGERLPI